MLTKPFEECRIHFIFNLRENWLADASEKIQKEYVIAIQHTSDALEPDDGTITHWFENPTSV